VCQTRTAAGPSWKDEELVWWYLRGAARGMWRQAVGQDAAHCGGPRWRRFRGTSLRCLRQYGYERAVNGLPRSYSTLNIALNKSAITYAGTLLSYTLERLSYTIVELMGAIGALYTRHDDWGTIYTIRCSSIIQQVTQRN
jgi:hypothetical protein